MDIAVIGWGSIVWSVKGLRVRTRWRTDGPTLPVEFARISTDGSLTLVLCPGHELQRTYWAISETDDLKAAIGNLRLRIKCKIENIHSYSRKTGRFVGDVHPEIQEGIKKWMARILEVDAAVWTGLGSNWIEKRHRSFSEDDALSYLKELQEKMQAFQRTRESVRNAPHQIQTRFREYARHNFRWSDRQLASAIFERAPTVEQ